MGEYRVVIIKRIELFLDAKSKRAAKSRARELLDWKLGDRDFRTTVMAEKLAGSSPDAMITALGANNVTASAAVEGVRAWLPGAEQQTVLIVMGEQRNGRSVWSWRTDSGSGLFGRADVTRAAAAALLRRMAGTAGQR